MSCRRSRSCLRGGHRAKAKWRKVKESNPRPRGRPGFRDRLRATTHHLPSRSQ